MDDLLELVKSKVPEKVAAFVAQAQRAAEEDFAAMEERIKNGDYDAVGLQKIKLYAAKAGVYYENPVWIQAYDEKMCAQFALHEMKVMQVARGMDKHCFVFVTWDT